MKRMLPLMLVTIVPGCIFPSFTTKPEYFGVPNTVEESSQNVAIIRGMGDHVKNPNNLLETWGGVGIHEIDGKVIGKETNQAYLSPGEHTFKMGCWANKPVQTDKQYFSEFKFKVEAGKKYYPGYELKSTYAKGNEHHGTCSSRLQTYRMQK